MQSIQCSTNSSNTRCNLKRARSLHEDHKVWEKEEPYWPEAEEQQAWHESQDSALTPYAPKLPKLIGKSTDPNHTTSTMKKRNGETVEIFRRKIEDTTIGPFSPTEVLRKWLLNGKPDG